MLFFSLLSLLVVVCAVAQFEDGAEYSVRCQGFASGCELVKGRLQPPAQETVQFILDQMDYAKKLAQSKRNEDVYYDKLAKFLLQFQGMLDGQNAFAADGEKVSYLDLLLLEGSGDLYDIVPATVP